MSNRVLSISQLNKWIERNDGRASNGHAVGFMCHLLDSNSIGRIQVKYLIRPKGNESAESTVKLLRVVEMLYHQLANYLDKERIPFSMYSGSQTPEFVINTIPMYKVTPQAITALFEQYRAAWMSKTPAVQLSYLDAKGRVMYFEDDGK
jgi:hypothetical protein